MCGERRSREGAWIEIFHCITSLFTKKVAPARERGLKCKNLDNNPANLGRSREGAWIEIALPWPQKGPGVGRSREGAWIEIR